jgi:hypothetical protein
MSVNQRDALFQTLNHTFRKAVEKQTSEENAPAIVDLFLYPNIEAAEFSVMDDEDRVLARSAVAEWEQDDEEQVQTSLNACFGVLKDVVAQAQSDGLFDRLNLIKPFSVLVVDEDMESLQELLLIDDDQLILEDDFVKKMDDELDRFFTNLMSDL